MRKINHIVIHCSATRPSQDTSAADIDRMHRGRGWLGIGYHYVIKRDGTVETGRPLEKPGAHVEGHNAYSIGICLSGGVAEDGKTPEMNYTKKQFNALEDIMSELTQRFPKAEVLGHRDFKGVKKACPCFDVREWFSTLKGPKKN
ncbi:N-acetylmuramoyl-L-alanine amidase [Oxalobacter vibrioformis]|uniref:N-acetylmuramoyl-L-alanine amidase n=1 Tax=Oxalobacter vibrioformis TaxID=933080 RepID=A0A9E9LVK8_9BURK|nr:N-acetylmuramoyl-L-alanine amidase [Oxalobacter vibrioformis]WAW09981.1 N-acetylmuramoyl-L-alanine amidase [Oxalobacter vibrioformis]